MPAHRQRRVVGYYSMEIAVDPEVPTYSGGLGILAGDHLRSAADLGIPMVGMTMLYRCGYFQQNIDENGWQQESRVDWHPTAHLTEVPQRVSVTIGGHETLVRSWKYEVKGVTGHVVPVYFLDTDLPENKETDRHLSHWLYGGDEAYRLAQEVVLGIGGTRMLRVLGYHNIKCFHMNEGHAALLGLDLLLEESRMASGQSYPSFQELDRVREQCIFTTHTPVPAGHDRFSRDLVNRVLRKHPAFEMPEFNQAISGGAEDGQLNMTYLAISLSHSVNGVAERHAEVSREILPGQNVGWITNGVHVATWTAPAMRELYDSTIPGWREHNDLLRNAMRFTDTQIDTARHNAKVDLLNVVKERTGQELDPSVLTLGFARRFTAYKRATLLLSDLERLRQFPYPLQVVYAGKAHPRDHHGKELIQQVFQAASQVGDKVKIVFLPNYDMQTGRLMASGVDVWLNTPQPPLEASGTSGMKAAVNGVPSLSVVDGWWVEGLQEGVTGWSIGPDVYANREERSWEEDAADLYDKLEHSVAKCYYLNPNDFRNVVRQTIAFNGSFFNTHRMVMEYALKAYRD